MVPAGYGSGALAPAAALLDDMIKLVLFPLAPVAISGTPFVSSTASFSTCRISSNAILALLTSQPLSNRRLKGSA